MADRPGRAVFSAAAAAFIPRGRHEVLLVHHRKSGHWVLPGGKTEWDEPPRDTCDREATEELGGVPLRIGRLLVFNWLTKAAELFPGAGAGEFAYPCHMFTFHTVLTPRAEQRIRVPERELLGWRWWDVDEACRPGVMEPYNARNLRTAASVHHDRRSTAYLES
ncbi:NUDIX domain-containing protein [Kitasatospora sp. HPMI-4]|uniref:NUDIX domain-containing protein n=1 Tax=Kitasatospora sp. HPMI-4 TaxID=3448443 RepID=UPI003F1A3835